MAVPCEMLLYPELLSNEQLITIVQERYLRIPNLERMDRCELLELFKNYCVPYGQRKYRDSGRGKLLNKSRPKSPEPAKLHIFNDKHSNNYRKTQSINYEKLKPPPDLLSGHMKRIKLDVYKVENKSKRKMSVDSITPPKDSPPSKKGRKPITWP